MNNRQANGRRRGRGGQQQQRSGGGSGQRDNGNRIDSRARGNAAQLLEKYKNLARDAQMQGDRVNTEYYLQFADHYFRVLSETRARFEENNPGQQAPRISRPTLEDDDFGMEGEPGREDGNQNEQREERQSRDDRDDGRNDEGRREERQGRDRSRDDRPREDRQRDDRPREERQSRDDRPREERQSRDDRPREDRQRNGRSNGNGNANGNHRSEAPQQDEGFEPRRETRDEEQPRRRANNRPRREEAPEAEAPSGLDLAVLPPAIAIVADEAPAEEKPKARRGRPRRDADAPAA